MIQIPRNLVIFKDRPPPRENRAENENPQFRKSCASEWWHDFAWKKSAKEREERRREEGGREGGLCRPRLLSEAGQAWSFPLEKPLENEENRGFRWESEPREDRAEREEEETLESK